MKVTSFGCSCKSLVLLGSLGIFVPEDWDYNLIKFPSKHSWGYADAYLVTHKPSDTSLILKTEVKPDDHIIFDLEFINSKEEFNNLEKLLYLSPDLEEGFKNICSFCVCKYQENVLADDMVKSHNLKISGIRSLNAVILAARLAEVDISEVLLNSSIDTNYGEEEGIYSNDGEWCLFPDYQYMERGFKLNKEFYPAKVAIMHLRDILKKHFSHT